MADQKKLDAANEKLVKDQKNLAHTIQDLRDLNKLLKAQNEKSGADLEGLNIKQTQLIKDNSRLTSEGEGLRKQVHDLATKQGQLEQAKTTLESEKAGLNGQYEKDKKALEDKNTSLKEQFEKEKKVLEDENTRLKGKLTVIQDDEKPITTPWNTNMDVKCGSWETAAACFHISKNELQALNNGRGKYENDMVLQVPVTKWITDDQFKTWEGVVKNFDIIGGTAELFRINRNTINGTTPYTTSLSVYVPMRSPV